MFKKKNFSQKIFAKIDKKAIKYCSSKDENGGEIILGKKGAINVLPDEITVVCDGTIVFRCLLKNAQAFELMSLGGVTITGDCENGKRKTVTCYYTSP